MLPHKQNIYIIFIGGKKKSVSEYRHFIENSSASPRSPNTRQQLFLSSENIFKIEIKQPGHFRTFWALTVVAHAQLFCFFLFYNLHTRKRYFPALNKYATVFRHAQSYWNEQPYALEKCKLKQKKKNKTCPQIPYFVTVVNK